MRLPVKARHLPPRLVIGAYVLNSGVSKLAADEQTAKGLHQMASGTYPFLGKLSPERFVKLLGATEVTLGAALLLPIVSTKLAASGLAAFSSGLVGLYLRTPGMRQPGSLRPSPNGIALAKDTWLVGAAAGLLVDEFTARD